MKHSSRIMILSLLCSGTVHPGISDITIPWQKVIPYTVAVAGVAFGLWSFKKAPITVATVSTESLADSAKQELLKKFRDQGIDIACDDQNKITLIKTKGVRINCQNGQIDFYADDMKDGGFRLFNNHSEKPIITINSLVLSNGTLSTFKNINSALFYVCVKGSKDSWQILDGEQEKSRNLQFEQHQDAQIVLDELLVKV